ALREDCEHTASDLEAPLERLPTVCVDAQRDALALVIALAELSPQELDGVVLIEKLGLKVETRRQSEIGVGGPGEAVDAAVATAAVGVDRLLEADIRGVVGRDHAFGVIGKHRFRQ